MNTTILKAALIIAVIAIILLRAFPAPAQEACAGPYLHLCERSVSSVSVSLSASLGRAAVRRISPPPGIVALVDAAALSAGVPSNIAHAVIRHESGYRAGLRGAAGEWGLGQIKCQSARSVGFTGSCHELRDEATNLRWSMAFLKRALDKGGATCAGVSLYNVGIFARPRCTAYGRIVMAGVR
ncbi:MAG: transglycosylase SLT domain-containing protein [Variibacter sp.]